MPAGTYVLVHRANPTQQLEEIDYTNNDASLRIRTPSGLTTYADVTVIRGRYEPRDREAFAVTNPTLIVEVVSTTPEYDRGAKFEHYKSIHSLKQYALVLHGERAIEVWTRVDDGWCSVTHATARSPSCRGSGRLSVSEVYDTAGVT